MLVVDLLEKLGLYYKESGQDYVVNCLNPDHEDRNPSMRIDKSTGIFHCLSCGHKGNLYHYAGIKQDYVSKKVLSMKNKIVKLLADSGLSIPEESIFFNSDYRNISGSTYSKFEAFTNENLFQNRLVFPIRDLSDNIVAFIARNMFSQQEPRYIVHPKKVSLPLFPAKPKEVNKGTIVLVEGIFDALNLIDKGIQPVQCVFGSPASMDKSKYEHYKIWGIYKIIIIFDPSENATKNAKKLQYQFEQDDYDVDIVQLPENTDPGDLSQEQVDNLKEGLNL